MSLFGDLFHKYIDIDQPILYIGRHLPCETIIGTFTNPCHILIVFQLPSPSDCSSKAQPTAMKVATCQGRTMGKPWGIDGKNTRKTTGKHRTCKFDGSSLFITKRIYCRWQMFLYLFFTNKTTYIQHPI